MPCFQSHFGLILSPLSLEFAFTEHNFQSHFGLILSLYKRNGNLSVFFLSIPFWSDFILKEKFYGKLTVIFFQSHFGLILSKTDFAYVKKQEMTLSIPFWSDFISSKKLLSFVGSNVFQSHFGLILSRFTPLS